MADYKQLRAAIDKRLSTDPEFRTIVKRINSGRATLIDTERYSQVLAHIVSRELSGEIIDLADREKITAQVLRDSYDNINEVCTRVQKAMDEKAGIHIRPQQADFPGERVEQFAHSLVDPTVEDAVIKRRARAGSDTITKSFHDDYIKKNATFRNDAGLNCYIIREGSNCCQWCSNVAGKYKFGTQPSDIFRRHDNCDCTIIYDGQVLRGKQNADGSRSKTWEEVPNVPESKLTVLSGNEARTVEQQNLQRFRGLTNGENSGKIKTEGVKPMTISSIDSPIEQRHNGKGNPNAINIFGAELNNRQKLLLEKLPEFDSRTIVPKDSVNMADLAALTAETGNEFAMFTKRSDRLIIRGNEKMVNIDVDAAEQLAKEGYRWSGHTHPGMDFIAMQPSDGDYAILDCFKQESSVIYNSKGDFRTFERRK